MKKRVLILLCLGTFIYANSEISWVDEQLEAIKLPRETPTITPTADPFIFLPKNRTQKKDDKGVAIVSNGAQAVTKPKDTNETEQTYNLVAIINAKAMINDSWYKKDDKISKYTITEITKNRVTLKSGKKELVLSTTTSGSLNFKNK